MKFKLYFPAGYRTDLNVADEMVDIYIITEDASVYSSTLYSIKNIMLQMEKSEQDYFWSENMVIVHDLKEPTINNAISNIVCSDSRESIISKIGDIEIFKKHEFYSQLNDWIADTPAWLMAG